MPALWDSGGDSPRRGKPVSANPTKGGCRREQRSQTIADAAYIRNSIDVRRVAEILRIRGSGKAFHCWKGVKHANGDADPSVRLWRNRLRCFVCDGPCVGPIDLVMTVVGLDVKQAIDWIADRFEVPRIPVTRQNSRANQLRYYDLADPMAFLVRSHIYAWLSGPGRQLVPVMLAFSEQKELSADSPRDVQISYRALMRYSGLGSPNSVRNGLRELEIIGWLSRRAGYSCGPVRSTGRYVVRPFAQSVVELAHQLAREAQSTIAGERTHRRSEREAVLDHFRLRQAIQLIDPAGERVQ